jgi:hypothetical protein
MSTVTFNQLGRYGRLGNQMFQIAATIGIARRNNYKFAFPFWKNYDHLERFGSTEDIDTQKYFVNHLPLYTGPKIVHENFVHWGYWPIRLTGNNISLTGHMQSEKYFLHCQDEVRHYFKMKDEYQPNDFCALHVRLGDYDDNYHPRLKMDYYARAMDMMPKGTKFLVFSDGLDEAIKMIVDHFGIAWAKDNIEPYAGSGAGYMDDFKFMKSCKHFIIGNSTFSWWPAWLSQRRDKKVIAPANWFGSVANLSSKDIYCNGWEVI